MISMEQIAHRLNTGVQLSPAEASLFLRGLLTEVNKMKADINDLKVSVSRPGVDPDPPATVSAPKVRRKADS